MSYWYGNGWLSGMKNILPFVYTFFILCLVLNCSAVPMNNLHYQREWMLVEFDNFTRQQLIENKAEINLTGEKTGSNKMKGNALMGCNKIFFVAEFKNNERMKISGLGSTEMACNNSSLEDAFLRKFEKMNRYTIKGHWLTLSDRDGNKMKFIASDWD